MKLSHGSPTTSEKVSMYEGLLHDIQLNAEVTMNSDNMRKLIRNICNWSYAHRSGNGELTEEERQERIDSAFRKLCEHDSGTRYNGDVAERAKGMGNEH